MADFGILPNMASSVATGAINSKLQQNLAAYNAKLNYQYNEMAARNADARQRALYEDYLNPVSRIAQLKEAGLSPSLYADGGGAGSQGMTQGAQGSGASGVGLPTPLIAPLDAAQIRLANAQADKTTAEAETLRGDNERGKAEINQLQQNVKKTIEETNNVGLKNAYLEYENALQSLKVGFEASTFDAKIENYLEECKYLKHKVRSAKVKADVDENTQNDVENLIHENLHNVIADTMLKRAQKELEGKQLQVSDQQIKDLISQIENRGKQTQINRDTLNQTIKEWATENGLIINNAATFSDYWQKVLFGEHSHDLIVKIFQTLAGK